MGVMEALIIPIVFAVAAAVYLSARFQAQSVRLSPQQELAQLRERLAWHEDRLRQAREKYRDADMIDRIAGELSDTRRELARFNEA